MLSALRRLDKKFLVFVGLLIGLPIILVLFLVIIRGCGNSKMTYQEYEQKMITATEKYLTSTKKSPTTEGEVVTVKLDELINGEYIKSTENTLDDTSCSGEVTVRRNGASVETTKGGYLNYIVDLKCKDYSTLHLVDKLKESVVTVDSGLYLDGNKYIFKGNKVNNYVNLHGVLYRIISIDENDVLKLVKTETESVNRMWDNKYNVETGKNSGKNIYKDSKILEYLLYDYNNLKKMNESTKAMIMAYDVCVGKRDELNYNIDETLDCSEKLEKQVISLLNVSDYAKASLDPDCKDLKSRSCNNYNYLSDVVSSTWSLNSSSNNSYNVFMISSGLIETQSANTMYSYNIVIYVDGNQLYTSGVGTATNPYLYGED